MSATMPTAPKVAAMVSHAVDLETIVVATEMEALILENTLIKKYHPHYNIMLRDDKTIPISRSPSRKITRASS